jgi:gamma-glutamyltranspeptidase/glutathione hydrolase
MTGCGWFVKPHVDGTNWDAGIIARTAMNELSGVIEPEDLSDYKAEWVEPIETDYHGWKVFEIPSNSQGVATLEMLNIMSQFPLASYGAESGQRFHVEMQAQQLAYSDLHRYVGDPRFVKVPVAGMLSMDYAKERSKSVDLHQANCDFRPRGAAGRRSDAERGRSSSQDRYQLSHRRRP